MGNFRLEHLLKYNRNQEEQNIINLANADKNLREYQEKLDNIKILIEKTEDKLNKLWSLPNVNIDLIKIQNNHKITLEQKLAMTLSKIAGLKKIRDEKREILIKSKTKVKTVEHLKDKYFQKEEARQKKIDQNQIDENNTNRFIYKK